jgi:hypothetical protein
MRQDEIIEMAREAGFDCYGKKITWDDVNCTDELIAFANLAAAKEREACAKLAEEYGTWGGSGFYEWFKKLGAEIRARGEQA